MKEKIITTLKLISVSLTIGLVGGLFGSAFSHSVRIVTELREKYDFILYFMPLAGLVIAFLYRHFAKGTHVTHTVIESAYKGTDISPSLGFNIFVSTVLTHLTGGSAGREGAALQLGGTIGSYIGNTVKSDTDNKKIFILCGMSAVFSSLFGTPITASVFVCELTCRKFFPIKQFCCCMVSSFTAFFTSKLTAVTAERFILSALPDYSIKSIAISVLIGILSSLIAYLFILTLKYSEKLSETLFRNEYLRALTSAVIIIIFIVIFGRDYCGGGSNLIEESLAGKAVPETFLLKILLTSLTVSGGFKGGEIVPTLCIGATFGALAGTIIGFSPELCAACGMISLFSAVTGCPIASFLLSAELLSGKGLIFTAISSVFAFLLTRKINIFDTDTFESKAVRNIFRKAVSKHKK